MNKIENIGKMGKMDKIGITDKIEIIDKIEIMDDIELGRLSFINDFGCLGIIYGYVLVPSTIFLLC